MAKAAYPTIGIAALVMFGIVYFIGCLQIKIISEFCVIGKLQCAGICGKLQRRNKLWSSGKLSDNNLDDKADYSYLCGGNNN